MTRLFLAIAVLLSLSVSASALTCKPGQRLAYVLDAEQSWELEDPRSEIIHFEEDNLAGDVFRTVGGEVVPYLSVSGGTGAMWRVARPYFETDHQFSYRTIKLPGARPGTPDHLLIVGMHSVYWPRCVAAASLREPPVLPLYGRVYGDEPGCASYRSVGNPDQPADPRNGHFVTANTIAGSGWICTLTRTEWGKLGDLSADFACSDESKTWQDRADIDYKSSTQSVEVTLDKRGRLGEFAICK